MIHLILCGGSGTRLWPLSRECKPKQFISFMDSKSLLQKTALGNKPLCEGCIVVSNYEHYYITNKQLLECSIKPYRYVLEPLPKNTAAAVCLGLQKLDPESIVLITPADHHTDYSENYYSAIHQAEKHAKEGFISVFGITPLRAETGFGYIETTHDGWVKHFHEKPDATTAQDYIKKGGFYWNSGMVCSKVGVLLKALQEYSSDILINSQEAFNHAEVTEKQDSSIFRISQEYMRKIPSLSLDYALLEKIKSLRCVLASFTWTDVGSFDSLFTHLPKDSLGNAVDAKNFVSIDSKGNLIMGNQRMISAIDVEDLVVVDTPDALLISRMGSTQKVRDIVHQLKTTTQLHKSHAEEQRPWGCFTVLDVQETFRVKRFIVSPGKKLSLQKHRYRSEHWVVVSGTAKVSLGNTIQMVELNQSIFIPQGEIHRVENTGIEDLVIIEVQYGNYVGEDDIIRIEDDYSRIQAEAFK